MTEVMKLHLQKYFVHFENIKFFDFFFWVLCKNCPNNYYYKHRKTFSICKVTYNFTFKFVYFFVYYIQSERCISKGFLSFFIIKIGRLYYKQSNNLLHDGHDV